MKNEIIKSELEVFVKKNYPNNEHIIKATIYFYNDLNQVGLYYKNIIEILALGMYEYKESIINEIKEDLLNFRFTGNYPLAPDFDINKSYYTFYQIKVDYSKKAILIGFLSPVGFYNDMGINWLKVISYAYYNINNVKNSIIEFPTLCPVPCPAPRTDNI